MNEIFRNLRNIITVIFVQYLTLVPVVLILTSSIVGPQSAGNQVNCFSSIVQLHGQSVPSIQTAFIITQSPTTVIIIPQHVNLHVQIHVKYVMLLNCIPMIPQK